MKVQTLNPPAFTAQPPEYCTCTTCYGIDEGPRCTANYCSAQAESLSYKSYVCAVAFRAIGDAISRPAQ